MNERMISYLKLIKFLDNQSDSYRMCALLSGNSSVGRAQPCQGWGREFESRFPLQNKMSEANQSSFLFFRDWGFYPDLAGWQSGHAAACKAVDAGSIPASASKK